MAIPIVAYAATAIGVPLVERIVGVGLDMVVGDPEKRASAAIANTKLPNLIPGVEQFYKLWHSGRLKNWDVLQSWLVKHGVDLKWGAKEGWTGNLWAHLLTLARQRPGTAEVVQLYRFDRITLAEAHERLHELGYSNKRERTLVLGLGGPVPLGTVYELYQRGDLTEGEAKDELKANGLLDPVRQDWFLNRKVPLNLQDVRDGFNRGLFTENKLEGYYKRLGISDRFDSEVLRELLTFMPPASDLIRFAVKDVFDPGKLGLREMRAELEEQKELLSLLEAQGIKRLKTFDGQGNPKEWDVPLYYWIASYEELAPTQAYEFLHRLRPNRVQRYRFVYDPTLLPPGIDKPPGTTVVGKTPDGKLIVQPEPFGIGEVAKSLKDRDVNPVFRTRMAAIGYRQPGRIDVRRLYQDGVYGEPMGVAGWKREPDGSYTPLGAAEKELLEVNQDDGYSPFDASQLAYWTTLNWDKEKGTAERNKVAGLVCQAYQLGAIDKPETLLRLKRLGFQDKEAEARADNCDLSLSVKTLTTAVKGIRAAFLGGRLDENGTRAKLVELGLALPRIADHLKLWKVELIAKTPEPRAAQLCEWVGSGLLTIEEMRVRLRRLNWKEDDVERIARHCVLGHLAKATKEQQRVAAAQARAQQRLEQAAIRMRQRAEQEAARIQKRREEEARRRIRESEEGRTPSLLQRYFRRGLIGVDEARTILLNRGWVPADVERWLLTEMSNRR